MEFLSPRLPTWWGTQWLRSFALAHLLNETLSSFSSLSTFIALYRYNLLEKSIKGWEVHTKTNPKTLTTGTGIERRRDCQANHWAQWPILRYLKKIKGGTTLFFSAGAPTWSARHGRAQKFVYRKWKFVYLHSRNLQKFFICRQCLFHLWQEKEKNNSPRAKK